MNVKTLNAYECGTARTIKAQYFKISVANFTYQNDWGATGAIVYEES